MCACTSEFNGKHHQIISFATTADSPVTFFNLSFRIRVDNAPSVRHSGWFDDGKLPACRRCANARLGPGDHLSSVAEATEVVRTAAVRKIIFIVLCVRRHDLIVSLAYLALGDVVRMCSIAEASSLICQRRCCNIIHHDIHVRATLKQHSIRITSSSSSSSAAWMHSR